MAPLGAHHARSRAGLAVEDAMAVAEPVTLGASDLRLMEPATLAGLSLPPLP
jgi:hypothetical protein